MSEPVVSELDPRRRRQVEKAIVALEKGDAPFAISVFRAVLKDAPGCLEVRKWLREAQKKRAPVSRNPLARLSRGFSQTSFGLRNAAGSKRSPEERMESAEDALERLPENLSALRSLGEAALEGGYPKTAAYAFESATLLQPNDVGLLISLMRSLTAAGQGEEAVAVGERILKLDPGNDQAPGLIRDASVAQTLTAGRWSEERGFAGGPGMGVAALPIVADVPECDSSIETVETELRRLEDEAERFPDDPVRLRRVAEACVERQRFDEAVTWMGRARSTSRGHGDPALERREFEIRAMAHEAAFAAEPDQARWAALLGEWHAAARAFHEGQVERRPNESQPRWDLAEFLYQEVEDITAAARHYQRLLEDPKLRPGALFRLGCCFSATGKYDLAVEQFKLAEVEHSAMNDANKAVIYEMGLALEALGRQAEALEAYKRIFVVDMGFRDVAERVERAY